MQLQFNARNVDPTQGAEVWPDGTYPVQITKDELKEVKGSPHNKYVEYTMTCLAGPLQGKTISYRLNLFHDDAKTQEIAYRQLSTLCHVTGRLEITATEQLIGGQCCIVVGKQKDNPQYNQIFKLLDLNGNEPGRGSSLPPAPQPVPAYGQPGVPAYAQPGPAPTQQAPAQPQGGWAPPAQQAAQPAPAASGWQPPPQQSAPAGWQPPPMDAGAPQQPSAAAFPVPAQQQQQPAPSNWQPGAAPATSAAPWSPGMPIK